MDERKSDMLYASIFFGIGGLLLGWLGFKFEILGILASGIVGTIIGIGLCSLLNMLDDIYGKINSSCGEKDE